MSLEQKAQEYVKALRDESTDFLQEITDELVADDSEESTTRPVGESRV
tara:strand:- start:154 stop:297 length:144 start_codon:yes stop_codon:yes gene_type:complete